MATNFFERQDRARRSTGWLLAAFVAGMVAIVATTFVAATWATSAARVYQDPMGLSSEEVFPWHIPLMASGAALALILLGTLFKVLELRAGGGVVVAEQLGGQRISPDSRDPLERRLLNVVEEMAIASGIPVPPVYLLDEPGINAFAAGYQTGDAVLGVTRGAVAQLTRDELQGVMAHEFSHILNGDMRLGIRLIGLLHGILLLSFIGHFLFRMAAYSGGGHHSGRDRRDGGSAILVMFGIGVVLIILGSLGSFIGGLIKAAVSRQREYLADASAVQFTRNPQGIAGALKQIGAAVFGSRIRAASANQASHLFFAQGVWEGFTGLMATHPPLPDRIRAVDPQWDGRFPEPRATQQVGAKVGATASGFVGGHLLQAHDRLLDPALVEQASEHVGDPREIHRQYASELLAELPGGLLDTVREPYGARAVVYCLLFDPDEAVRAKQTEALINRADPGVLNLASRLQAPIAGLDPRVRLPLVDLAIPALRSLSLEQYHQFDACVDVLMRADQNLSLFEWTLGRILKRHLAPQFEGERRTPTHYYGLQRLGPQCSLLLSTLAHIGHGPAEAKRAFGAGQRMIADAPLIFMPREACGLPQLQQALESLVHVVPKHRGRVVDACAEVICADGKVHIPEAELLRGIADLLDCPIPPFVAGQRVKPAAEFASQSPLGDGQ